MNSHFPPTLLLATFASVCFAQLIPGPPACAVVDKDATYRTPPLTYPMTSDRYSVQYQLGSGNWTDVKVYISYYGGTNASPFRSGSGYVADTSMSFASIPAAANTAVALRVTKLWGTAFPAINHVSVRPHAKGIHVDSASGNLVQLSTATAANFAGDQFVLWWDGDAQQSSSIQGLVFFLNPPYAKPTGGNVKVIATPADLTGDLSHFDTLDFEGTVAIGSTGAQAFVVPANIANIFLAPGAWIQGKLRFAQGGNGITRRLYGPGVLDVSRFEYDLRACGDSSGYADQGYHAVSLADPPNNTAPDRFLLDGVVIMDHNHATADLLVNSAVNNVNSIGWNGLNGGFRIGQNTSVSNLFIRAGDDSLMMWGSFVTVTNATVWQNYNGGVVNLGWSNNSPGDYSLIDGLYVVKADWNSPTNPSWTATNLGGQNNAVIASLMVPGTAFGSMQPSLYKNIFVEDAPRTLFSLKILFPECNDPNSPRDGNCKDVDLTQPSLLNLDIENLSTPASLVENSIGFQTLPPGYADGGQTFPTGYTLTGKMNISLSNVTITSPAGTTIALTAANAATLGKIGTNGGVENLTYNPLAGPEPPRLTDQNAAGYGTVLAPEMIGFAQAPAIAPALAVFSGNNWPTQLSGVSINVTDSKGQRRPAPIYYVAPTSVGYLVPAGTALGTAQIALTTSAGATFSAPATINPISPGLFTADSTGSGAPAGFWVLASANGAQTYGYLFSLKTLAPAPVDLGLATDQVYLSLYGTGFRGYAGQAAATVGGIGVPVSGVAATGTYLGEDIVNVGPLPRLLVGRGTVDVVVSFDGKPANTVSVAFR
jgi:uncharacterized protein (TIGR03437 family)